jgi:glycosyltransferase involved in cell wall biosynthesis
MTRSAPKVSVVVPTYNQARYLPACLDSILFQDYPDLEVVVVCDPSPDGTDQVLEAYLRDVAKDTVSYACHYDEASGEIRRMYHPRYPQAGRELKVIRNPERLGQARSYNQGFRACTGELCTYVASDDICHPAMISSLAEPIIRGEADFAYSDMFVVDDAGRILREFKLPDYSFESCFLDWFLLGVSKLYRLDLHRRFGYFNESFVAGDHECYLRFAMNGAAFRRVPRVLYSVRSHEGRNTDAHGPDNWARLLDDSRNLVRQARDFHRAAGARKA